jgi:hypothetical protein
LASDGIKPFQKDSVHVMLMKQPNKLEWYAGEACGDKHNTSYFVILILKVSLKWAKDYIYIPFSWELIIEPNKLKWDEHSSLFVPFVRCKEKKVF